MTFRLAIVTCLWRRHELAHLALERFESAARSLGNVELIAVGSEGDKSRELAEQHNFRYLEHENAPLTEKWNAGVLHARTLEVDGILITGSDDWIDDAGIRSTVGLLESGKWFVGVTDLYFLNLVEGGLRYWSGYVGSREKEPIGLGRAYHRSLLDQLDWKPWSGRLNRNLDGNAWPRIRQHTQQSRMATGKMEEMGATVLAVKHPQSLTPVSHLLGYLVGAEEILRRFPRPEVDRLRGLMLRLIKTTAEKQHGS